MSRGMFALVRGPDGFAPSGDDDSGAIAGIIAGLPGRRGTVRLAPGDFRVGSTVSVPSGVTIEGSGRDATRITLAANVPAIQFVGTSGTHVSRSGLRDLTVSGSGRSIDLVRAHYADRLYFDRVDFSGADGALFRGVEVWDSRFNDCRFDDASSTSLPAVLLRSTDSWASSSDSVNNIHFIGCVWESFVAGGVWVEKNGGTASPHNIRLTDCKFESTVAAGNFIRLGTVVYSALTNVRCHVSSTGVTPFDVISMTNAYNTTVHHLNLTGNAGSVIRSGVRFATANGWSHFGPVYIDAANAPTVAWFEWVDNPVNVTLGHRSAAVGTMDSGAPGSLLHGPVARSKAGVVSDSDFPDTPQNGTVAIDTSNNRLYVRVGGTWRYAALT